jgi:hypothetical protein
MGMDGILDVCNHILRRWKVNEWKYKICEAQLLVMKMQLSLLVPAVVHGQMLPVMIWGERNWELIHLGVMTTIKQREGNRKNVSVGVDGEAYVMGP